MDWKSWKLKRKVRSSLAAESQALADAVDNLNYLRLFFAECILQDPIDLRQADKVLSLLPKAHVITDCQSLYDALEIRICRSRSLRETHSNRSYSNSRI